MWNVTSNVGGSVVSMYTRALLPWIGAGTMGGGGEGENERGQALLVRLFVCSFVRSLNGQFGRRPDSWHARDHVRLVPLVWRERDYKSLANERIPFVIAIVAAPVRCRFVASRLKYRGAATVSLPSSIVWKFGFRVELCKGGNIGKRSILTFEETREIKIRSNRLVY